MMTKGLAQLSVLMVASFTALVGAQTVSVESVMTHAGRYVNEFVDRFTNVVSEEHYIQAMAASSIVRAGSRRELKSDFLFVRPPGSAAWVPFRDVFEVDGRPVRDREQRLARLFLQQSASPTAALERANEIAAESSRYNVDSTNVKRTINNPLLAIAFLQDENRPRFRYELDRRDVAEGDNVWIVEYREQARPTLIRGAFDKNLPARGRYWIDALDGRVLRTELVLEDASVSAKITTDFRVDDRFHIDVPVRMTEVYRLTNGREVTGTATYGRFRRFDVSTDERLDNPR